MAELKIAILGSTKGTDMDEICRAIEKGEIDAEIVMVLSDREGALILKKAKDRKIPTNIIDYKKFPTRDEAEKEQAVKLLKELKVDLVLLIGYMKILSPYFVNAFRRRIWNIHPSLLPKYAGGMNLDVHAEVLKNKEKETGCTLHEVTEKVDDTERAIGQRKVEIFPSDTPEKLKERVQYSEGKLIVESLKKVINGDINIGEHK